jgi:hypothetical protein
VVSLGNFLNQAMKTEQIYHLIVQKILIYPTQLGKILGIHAHYVDEKLLIVMQQKASFLSEQGNQQAADFLSSLINQLQEELILQREKTLSLTGEFFYYLNGDVSDRNPSTSLISSISESSSDKEQLKSNQSSRVEIRYDENLDQEYGWSKWVAGILIIIVVIWGSFSVLDFQKFQFLEQEWTSYLNSLRSPSPPTR